MSVWLTPDREPFFGGTYFPPRDGARGALRGFLGILARDRRPVRARPGARARRDRLARPGGPHGARRARRARRGPARPGPIEEAVAFFTAELRPACTAACAARPSSRRTCRCGSCCATTGAPRDPESLRMATLTLEKMAAGGIHDQLGGGFHRYSTDARVARPALREDALRQRAPRRGLRRGLAGDAAARPRARRARDARLPPARDDLARGRLLLGDRRRLGGRGGAVLRLGGAGAPRRCSAPTRTGSSAFHGVTPEGNFEGRSILWVPRPDEDEWEALAPARARLYEARARRPAAAPRREGARGLERARDLRARLRRPGARRAALRRGGGARGGLRPRPHGEGRAAAADLARRRGGRPGVPRGPRVPRRGAPRPPRGDLRAALARGGGGPVRAAGARSSADRRAAAGSRPRRTTTGSSRARSRRTTAPSPRARRSRS